MPRWGILVVGWVAVSDPGWVAAAEVDYLRDIKPLLARKCAGCHGPLKQEGGLRLDAVSELRRGADTGPVVTPASTAESPLLKRIAATDPHERMPPEGEGEPLTAAQIDLLTRWIAADLPAPADEVVLADPRDHWAYQPPRAAELPTDVPDEWSATAIDRLLAGIHRSSGLTPVDVADRATLLRRVTYDLTGLPPTREELQTFLADDSPHAWERVVDRLLASPAYGERWARHWMDVWRYSDWDGFGMELRGSQRHIWRWRDWIVESLQTDKPYDRMILEMLAADEVSPSDDAALRATGFLARNYYKFNRNNWLETTVDHTAKAFLGITMECAKCHDHKYDPIAQTDFYRLRAVFEPYDIRTDLLPGQPDILQDGLARVYDAQPTTPTYLFTRGNEKQPVKDQPLDPGLPGIFATALEPTTIPLPVLSYYPALKPHVVEQTLQAAAAQVTKAREAVTQQAAGVAEFEVAWNRLDQGPADALTAIPLSHLADDFTTWRDDLWLMRGGEWSFAGKTARQPEIVSHKTELVTRQTFPRDFRLTTTFRLSGGSTYHSVGVSFDDHGPTRNSGVYVSAYAPAPKVQVLLERNGTQYPPGAERAYPITRDRDYLLEVRVRDRLVNVFVNGELAFVYQLPHEREPGAIALWTYDCVAEFRQITIDTLPATYAMTTELTTAGATVVADDLATRREKGLAALELARSELAAAEQAEQATIARVAADRAKYLSTGVAPEEQQRLAMVAAAAERREKELRARVAVLKANQSTEPEAKRIEQRAAAEKQLQEVTEALKLTDGVYTPLGTELPRESTGRRTALARWIGDRGNPLTARVAVNHVWQRLMGEPFVEPMFDFGLRSGPPVLQPILDTLAVDFMDHGWSLKRLQKTIVMSRAYQLASSAPPALAESNEALDRDNRRLWKGSIRRLEAEAVRDAVLAIGGALDRTAGGPDIDYAQGDAVPRRSLYFRHAYEKQMTFLVLFDAASPNECYRRSGSIIPQQALALANSPLVRTQAERLAATIRTEATDHAEFITQAFERILGRPPTSAERELCQTFLSTTGPTTDADLLHTLFNHNDFVTLR